jgi:3-phenylpropionate/cinnamic acid dioxygenase small subunit
VTPSDAAAFDAAALHTPAALQHEVEQFLFHEAALLDQHRLDDWFALLADDLHYVLPIRQTRHARDRDRELSGDRDLAVFDESKASIALRLRRLNTGSAWAEEPRSRTRRLVTNVRLVPTGPDGDIQVRSAFLLHRNRAEAQTDLFVGERRDVLRRAAIPAGFQIRRRRVVLDQATLLANNISVFF